jgi:BirA family biotin operon repressor/biotin-[acetyl-CoA-carboxylase] ligase
LLADGRFHSGAALARELGVSRTVVWSLIHELGALGLDVHAVHGKGYRLSAPLEWLDADAIRQGLSATSLRLLADLEIHERLDSTNTHLMNRARAGAPAGSVCLAETQTAGKGRLGRSWLSPFGGGIALSLLWRFDDYAHMAGLSLAVGVAALRALRRLGVEGVRLKWPNDILWQGRKLGGILLEAAGEAHGGAAVVIGLGLNGRIPAETGQAIDQDWTDLARIAPEISGLRNRLAAELLDGLLRVLADYERVGLAAYLDEWRASHALEGHRVTVTLGERVLRGRVAGVSPEGLLLLDGEDGRRHRVAAGDVRVRVNDPKNLS